MAPIWLKVNLMIIDKSLPRRYLWTEFNNFFTDLFMRKPLSLNKLYTEDILVSQCMYARPSVHPSILTAPGRNISIFNTKKGSLKANFWHRCR